MSDTGTITLTAGQKTKRNIGDANYLFVFAATGIVEVELRKNGAAIESPSMVTRKVLLDQRHFDEIIMTNRHGSNNDVRFFYGPGEYKVPADGAQVTLDDSDPIDVNMVNGSITVNQSVPNDIVPLSDVSVGATATTLAAADSDSLEVLISVPDTETDGIRVGDSTVTATKGLYLGPGQSQVFSLANHEVSAIRVAGASGNVTVTVCKMNRV